MKISLRTGRSNPSFDELAAARLSRVLRRSTDRLLARRRGVLVSALTAAGAMGFVSLYQMGVIRHLPEPPFPRFDADRVDASEASYKWLSTPDGVLGLASYAATAVLAAMGGADRAKRRPWLPLALAAKVGVDTAQALQLSVKQWTDFRAFCFWCLVATGASLASAVLVVPEAQAALRVLRKRS